MTPAERRALERLAWERYERALATRRKLTKSITDSIRQSMILTAEDYKLRVGPCPGRAAFLRKHKEQADGE